MTDPNTRPESSDPFGSSADETDGEMDPSLARAQDADDPAELGATDIEDAELEDADFDEADLDEAGADEAAAEADAYAAAHEPAVHSSQMPSPDGLPHRRGQAVLPPDLEVLAIARRAVELAEDKKAADIVLLDVTGLTSMADYFVLCTGGSDRQVGAIADNITEGLHKEHVNVIGREGEPESHWVLLDYGAVIVHIFAPPEREFYQLDRLWSEAKTILRVQ